MAVAAARLAAFNGRVGRHRVAAVIAFGIVVESNGHLCLRTGNGDERNADRPAVPKARAEIRMRGLGGADGRYVATIGSTQPAHPDFRSGLWEIWRAHVWTPGTQ